MDESTKNLLILGLGIAVVWLLVADDTDKGLDVGDDDGDEIEIEGSKEIDDGEEEDEEEEAKEISL